MSKTRVDRQDAKARRKKTHKRSRRVAAMEVEEGLAKGIRKVLARANRNGADFQAGLLEYLKRVERLRPEWKPILARARKRTAPAPPDAVTEE